MFRQWIAVIWMGLSTIPTRRGASLVVIVGMACAVGAMISILSISAGLSRTIHRGRSDRAIILSKDSLYEFASTIPHGNATIIADAPGIRADASGKPIASAEALAYSSVTKKGDGLNAFLTVRGMGPEGFALRPEIALIHGRLFIPGRHEVIVGKSATAQFRGLTEGSHIALPSGQWTVTGTFASGGDARESELLTDAATLLSSTRAASYKSETVELISPAAFDGFRAAIKTNSLLSVDVERETDFLQRQWQSLSIMLSTVGWLIGAIMGLGAMLGALNTMYNSIRARRVEIATLRALGFGGGAVIISVLTEAVLLAGIGALLGAGFAWWAFNGNLHVMGGLVVTLTVGPALLAGGAALACLLGLVGGLFPAIRAARQPVAIALRAT